MHLAVFWQVDAVATVVAVSTSDSGGGAIDANLVRRYRGAADGDIPRYIATPIAKQEAGEVL
ncbi:hypothetical protein NJB1907f44_38880 [Mycobacterium marinum]|nr:hypothetical protein NJB1907f34b_50390 [Mycobacterium marinum]GJO19850.1 hypothetical protein NJB1907E90_50140 [Mycobacterium marinum]GJO21189.1 hypothetical protein NJB1907E11_29660 [Mycobacterium marinum]GJO24980.1 hypothetical protein NJB1728e18_31210 [Mycobacterium marinum]GJO32726.1 hypothetical protein NJB1907f22_33710 [Mycobacterium marinum]